MSANYWESTQRRHWQFTKEQLDSTRQKLEEENAELVRMFPLPQIRHLYIYFNQQIIKLSKKISVRQQCIATAQVYLKRFYSKVEIRRTNPYLVVTTAVYLACKMEEAPQHIRMIVTEARALWSEFISLDTSKVGECEFFLISEMSSQLLIHQPYRTLTSLRSELSMTDEDATLAKSVINDSYMTDLPLTTSPHIIGLVAILLALVLRPSPGMPGQNNGAAVGSEVIKDKPQDTRISRLQQFASWLSDSRVDITAMVDATQEIISFYECHEHYQDKLTKEQINRFVKARGLDK
ncbi:unnamed protein product [Clonostachys solani]|uniref:RNA polymerase II holoenzyme cyclin-like subunit n=1 Tax=Clonostachys solani TaxID=160281 RepID=A0A9N9Z762_9HYPO|nr:unnamed protein product [Clonostachys solani]